MSFYRNLLFHKFDKRIYEINLRNSFRIGRSDDYFKTKISQERTIGNVN